MQVLEGELKSVVQRSSEDYTQHQQIITQLLQLQLKVIVTVRHLIELS